MSARSSDAEARKAAGRTPTQKEIADAQGALIRAELPTPAEKGRALARLVRARRTLLCLDGMEPLQYPAVRTGCGKGDACVSGALKDKGMALLLRELAADNPGLVIVTTRIKLRDLQEFRTPAVLSIPLTALKEAHAIELLKARGMKWGTSSTSPALSGTCAATPWPSTSSRATSSPIITAMRAAPISSPISSMWAATTNATPIAS